MTYENYSPIAILRQVLKNEPEQFSSFSIIGHLIHLNLKSNLDSYKQLIGQVLLDKNPGIRVVVNKLDAIETTFRNFSFETLASTEDPVNTVVQVRESGCTFRFDFAKVYWNPRLGTEHERIVKLLKAKQDVVYDVFAGVGPFAVPVAKLGCKVLANDLNPSSFAALQENAKLNKVNERLQAFNLDGKEFIESVLRDDLISEFKKRYKLVELQNADFHVLMNLPAIAVEFLPSFVGLFNESYESDSDFRDALDSDTVHLPTVHCYAFYKGLEEGHEELRQKAVEYLQWPSDMSVSDIKVHFVRTVAPNKKMLRISVQLPKQVLLTLPTTKRPRLE